MKPVKRKKIEKLTDLKIKMLTIRLNEKQERFIEDCIRVLEAQRGAGARNVSKTEAVLILLALGMEEFMKLNKLKSLAS